MTGAYFLSFSFEKEKERKYQRKEKKPIIFILYCSIETAILVRARRKQGAREVLRRFFHAVWYGGGLHIYAALILAE